MLYSLPINQIGIIFLVWWLNVILVKFTVKVFENTKFNIQNSKKLKHYLREITIIHEMIVKSNSVESNSNSQLHLMVAYNGKYSLKH